MKKVLLILACCLATPAFAYDNYNNYNHNSYQYNRNRVYRMCYHQAQRWHGRVDQDDLRRCMRSRGFRY